MCKVCENRGKLQCEAMDLSIENDKLVIDYSAYSCDSDVYEEIHINFCPICGKALINSIGEDKRKA